MKKFNSIKNRVTIYYAMVIIVISLVFSLMLSLSIEKQVSLVTEDTLIKTVQNSLDDIDYENQIIEIDNDFDSYSQGVTLLVYTESGQLIKGKTPKDFPAYTPLSSSEIQEIETEQHIWHIYDLYQNYDNGQGLWVRGIYAMDDALHSLAAIRHVMLLILPLLIVVAVFTGFKITKKAFEPVSEIAETANTINSGYDLSKRLPLNNSEDEIYQLSETINKMISRLEESFKNEKQFTSDVSHELKTPLAVISAECEYALSSDMSTEEYKESLETILGQTKRTTSMVQQLLQISRSFNKEQYVEKEIFNLSPLAEGTIAELSSLASDKGVQLISDIEDDIYINADETLLVRIIINLVNNGIKYMDSSKENPYVKFTLKKDSNQLVTLEVSDNGIGIAEENMDKVFQKFYKVDKSRTGSGESFGLGLAMVKWIVETHNGTISLSSQLKEGSIFTVKLPIE